MENTDIHIQNKEDRKREREGRVGWGREVKIGKERRKENSKEGDKYKGKSKKEKEKKSYKTI
jgi:hypothetical protein